MYKYSTILEGGGVLKCSYQNDPTKVFVLLLKSSTGDDSGPDRSH